MLMHPNIDPVALSLGPLKVHWYGLMYLVGFVGGYWLGLRRAGRPGSGWQRDEISDLLFYVALGVILGGRLGYVLFYNLGQYLERPQELLYIWTGGMSFHGGLVGVMVAMALYARKTRRGFFQVSDFIAPLVPLGLGAGRIGNFINQELWGKASELPWAMVFPHTDPTLTPRHPSMLYEALLEGLVLFIVLWWFSSKTRPRGAVSGLFLVCYGLFRILVEFVRLPDAHIGYLYGGWLTVGQLLSLPMLLFGLWLMLRAAREGPGSAAPASG